MNNALPCVISVEDDEELYELIRHTLHALPIDLHHAKSGREAILLARQLKVDLLILDIMLPDVNGWNVLKEIFASGCHPTGVIVLTAHTGVTHRVIAHLQDVTAYLTKPFVPQELRRKVIEVLQLPV